MIEGFLIGAACNLGSDWIGDTANILSYAENTRSYVGIAARVRDAAYFCWGTFESTFANTMILTAGQFDWMHCFCKTYDEIKDDYVFNSPEEWIGKTVWRNKLNYSCAV